MNWSDWEVIIYGYCQPCQKIVRHSCPRINDAIKAVKESAKVNLTGYDNGTFECPICGLINLHCTNRNSASWKIEFWITRTTCQNNHIIKPYTMSFFKGDFEVTVSGQCQKCNCIVNHLCPHGSKVRISSQRGGQVTLSGGSNGSFTCQFCEGPIYHVC